MAESEFPQIGCKDALRRELETNRGRPCVVILNVKYNKEKDWTKYELWMTPGWESGFLWRDAYATIRAEQAYTKYRMSDVEEARFDLLILV